MSFIKCGAALLLLLGTAVTTISMATAQPCNACNDQVLSQLIEANVHRALANEPRKLYPLETKNT